MQLTYRGCQYPLQSNPIAANLEHQFATYRGVTYDISSVALNTPVMNRSVQLLYRGIPYLPTQKISVVRNTDWRSPWIA